MAGLIGTFADDDAFISHRRLMVHLSVSGESQAVRHRTQARADKSFSVYVAARSLVRMTVAGRSATRGVMRFIEGSFHLDHTKRW
jgi:hypothetical protein